MPISRAACNITVMSQGESWSACTNVLDVVHVHIPAPIAQLVEFPLWGTGGHRFDSRAMTYQSR